MPSGRATETLYLVDAHSLIFQVFHAIRGMSSPSGLPTNALFGFTRDMLNLRKRKPDYLVCAFDRAEPTFRQELYTEYKANREEMPSDLQLQLPLIHRLLEADPKTGGFKRGEEHPLDCDRWWSMKPAWWTCR